MLRSVILVPLIGVALGVGCGDGVTNPPGAPLEIVLTGLLPIDASAEGVYEAWVIGDGEIVSAGRFSVSGDPSTQMLRSSIPDPTHLMITLEPPGDDDDGPSLHRLLGGRFEDGRAALDVIGYLTVAGVPLESSPGTHVLASSSDNESGSVPSETGLWLFNLGGDTLDGSYYLDFSPLTEGWSYEGWIVLDYGAADAVWLSYGKFRPDAFRQANARDDTGLGPFSGRRDYERALALQVRVPGDDWLANPLGLSVPGGLELPLDLNGDAASGTPSRWTHVITVEPWGPNRDPEPFDVIRPFFLTPYRNLIGEAPPEEPRSIEFHPGGLPSGTAVMLR